MPAESFLQKFHDLARGRGGNFKRVSSHFIFAVFLILAVYNEDIPPVKLIFPDGDFVRFPIEPGLGATGLANFSGSSEHGRQINLIRLIRTVTIEAAVVMATRVTSLI